MRTQAQKPHRTPFFHFPQNSVPYLHHLPPANMTSDYVIAVLFRLRWEAVDCIDDYMMGVYDITESYEDVSDEPELPSTSRCSEVSCQTPKSWLFLQQAQERKEAKPERAPPRNRPLEPGMTTPRIENRVPVDLLRPLDQNSLALVRAVQMRARRRSPGQHQMSGVCPARRTQACRRYSSGHLCSA